MLLMSGLLMCWVILITIEYALAERHTLRYNCKYKSGVIMMETYTCCVNNHTIKPHHV